MAFDNNNRRDHDDYGEQITTKAVRAGKRTYFFDVKATRGDDYFITITESRKFQNDDGSVAGNIDSCNDFLQKYNDQVNKSSGSR